jgi:hypothetical protein
LFSSRHLCREPTRPAGGPNVNYAAAASADLSFCSPSFDREVRSSRGL